MMTWNYAYTPSLWLPITALILLSVLLVYSWRHRNVPAAKLFAIACLFGMLWLSGIIMSHATADVAARIFWVKFQSTWQLPAATTITCFILEYTWPSRWLTRRNVILLSIMPVLFMLIIVSSDLHHLAWVDHTDDATIAALQGTVIWFFFAYGYGLGIINLVVLTWLYINSRQHRLPVAIMMTGQLVFRGAFLVETVLIPHTDLPLGIIALAFLFMMYAIVLFGFYIFDPIVLAQQKAIENMRSGMLVLDNQRRITSINPTTAMMLRVPVNSVRGKHVDELLPTYATKQLDNPDTSEIQFSMKAGQDDRHYTLASTKLKDWHGQEVGQLLILRDVTERKQAELALKESEEIQRLIFENASDGISIFEEYPGAENRRILECNERYAEMSGRTREELLSIGDTALIQKPLSLLPYAKPRTEITAARSTGVFTWIRPDGKENIIEYSAATVRVGQRLLTIGLDREVTERKYFEAQVLEQQRALAVLQEREQLAHELHDNLAQVFGFINTQGQAIRHLLSQGDVQTVDAYVSQLIGVAREANVDIRESILSLRMTLSENGLAATIAKYLTQYERNFGIRTELTTPDGSCDEALEPMVEVQLLRILQEALTNVRKHAIANSVRITLTRNDNYVQVTIQDDGKGFVPAMYSDVTSEHIGLRVMRERAQEIGGSINLHSDQGQGTKVVVRLPIRNSVMI